MDAGNFCFINESYFDRFEDSGLMMNHVRGERSGYRPYYVAFRDKNNPEIYWAIPLSSNYEKYNAIRKDRVAKNSQGRCDTIQFAKFMNKDNAFLIQNMCPVTEDYIVNTWIRPNGTTVAINSNAHKRISTAASRVLRKVQHGAKIVFPDIISICDALNAEIRLEQALPVLKANPTLLSNLFVKNTARGIKTVSLEVVGSTGAGLKLFEIDTSKEGGHHTKTTAISDAHFIDRLMDVLETNWDKSIEKDSELPKSDRDGFEDALDRAEIKAAEENFDLRIDRIGEHGSRDPTSL